MLFEENTFNSYMRPDKPFKQPQFFNKYMSAADSLLHARAPFQHFFASVCLSDDLSVFTWMSLISLLQQWVEYIVLWKLSTENTCCSSFCEKNRPEDCQRHSRHAATVKMTVLSYALGTILWKKWVLFPWCRLVTRVLHAPFFFINLENCCRC